MKQIPDICQIQQQRNQKEEVYEHKNCNCDKLSEAETEYLDFTVGSPVKCSDYDEDCFCQTSEDMNKMMVQLPMECNNNNNKKKSDRINVIKKEFTAHRRMIKIRIKTSTDNDCLVDGETTENGIKICISPRRDSGKVSPVPMKSNTKKEFDSTTYIMSQDTVSVASSKKILTSSEIESSALETDYEFRKNLKNELRHSPGAIKVLKYLESLSENKKRSADHSKKKSKRKSKGKEMEEKPNSEEPKIMQCDSKDENMNKRRSKSKTPPRVSTPHTPATNEDDEFHDCFDGTSHSHDHSSSTSNYEDTSESFDASQSQNTSVSKEKDEVPLITITQEMSTEMVVTSKVEVNKDKLRRMNDKRKKRHESQQFDNPKKIIDENFCNELLDQMNQTFEKQSNSVLSEHEEDVQHICESSSSSNYRAGPRKPPRTFAYRRPRTISGQSSDILEPLNMDLYEEMKQLKLFQFNHSRTNSNFQNKSMDNSMQQPPTCPDIDNNFEYGWTSPEKTTFFQDKSNKQAEQEVNSNCDQKIKAGWNPSVNHVVPGNIMDMLHYSDDEIKSQQILSSNSKAEPQRNSDPK